MEIFLPEEKAYYFIPQFSVEVAHDRLEQKKASLAAGAVGALLSRPKPEEITLLSFESRLEAFWVITVFARTAYDRNRTYTIQLNGGEIEKVTILGQDLTPSPNPKGGAIISLNGTEHCVEERKGTYAFDSAGIKGDFTRYFAFPKTEIADLAQFAPPDVLVVPPQALASTVVRTVLSEMIQPVQAQVIHEERVNIEALELNFRPVYAMEYEWTSKGKRVVVEFDAMNGDIRSGGKKLRDQIKSMVTSDLVFDVTADAAGMLVPGGSIAVKLVKAVVDRSR